MSAEPECTATSPAHTRNSVVFPRAVGALQEDSLTRSDVEIDTSQRREAAGERDRVAQADDGHRARVPTPLVNGQGRARAAPGEAGSQGPSGPRRSGKRPDDSGGMLTVGGVGPIRSSTDYVRSRDSRARAAPGRAGRHARAAPGTAGRQARTAPGRAGRQARTAPRRAPHPRWSGSGECAPWRPMSSARWAAR